MTQPVLLQLLPSLYSGGVERGTLDIANAAVQAGYRSLVASAGGTMVAQLEAEGSLHVLLPLASKNPLVIYRNISRLEEVIRQHQVTIVHARSRVPAWSGYFAARRTGCHFVTTFHGFYNAKSQLKKCYNGIMTKGERVIAVSNSIATHITTHYPAVAERVHIIPRGVDMQLFNPDAIATADSAALRTEYGIPENRLVLLLPGRITRWKGHAIVLEALRLLPPESYYCLMIGDDKGHTSYRQELESRIAEYGLQSHVKIHPHRKDIQSAYALADIVLSASVEREAFGRVSVEGQAMKKLVIATAVGGSCETIVPDKTGWLVPPGDKSALANAIAYVVTLSEAQRVMIGEKARQHIAEHFSLEHMCTKTLALYQKIIANP